MTRKRSNNVFVMLNDDELAMLGRLVDRTGESRRAVVCRALLALEQALDGRPATKLVEVCAVCEARIGDCLC